MGRAARRYTGERMSNSIAKRTGVPFDPIGAQVLARMNDLNLGVAELAKLAKMPRVPLSFWLNGQRGLRSDRVARVLTALNLAIVDAGQHDATPPTDGEHGQALIQTYVERCCSLGEGKVTTEADVEASWGRFCKSVEVDPGPRGVVGRLLRESYGHLVRPSVAPGPRGGKKRRNVYLGLSLTEEPKPKRRRKK